LGRLWWWCLVTRSRVLNSLVILWRAPWIYSNWPHFLLSRLRDGTGLLRTRSGLQIKFRTRSTDRSTASEVFLLDAYLRAPDFTLAPGDTVLDIGANIGCFTLQAARHCPQGRIFAVEPLPANYALLEENIALNRLANVHARCLALSASDGTQTLHHGGQCTSLHWNATDSQAMEVPTRTLRSFLAAEGIERVDFLKMDCEGAEFDILLSAGPEELGRIRRIVMEYHNLSPEKNHRVLAAHLERHGFTVALDEGGWNGELRASRRAGGH
jgi:FkbM family methyltransferase